MIDRFRKAYANWRKNPFTGDDLSVQKTETNLVIPSTSPAFIQLLEVPRKDTPSSVSVFNVTDQVYMTEVTSPPAQNQFRVDYPPPDGQGTGLVEFSSLDSNKVVNITYYGTGSPVVTEFLDTLMSHPLSEADGDIYYYYNGDVQRIGGAIDTTTLKFKSTVLNAVNLNSTDNTFDKVISNAQGKKWEDHSNSNHEFATPIGAIIAWLGGYFTSGANTGYTVVLGGTNTIAGANSYLNPLGWYVCDGSALNDPQSPIFNGEGRYLPNLTDSRFIMGSNAGGSTGGANTTDHTHEVGTYVTNEVTGHQHSISTTATNTGGQTLNHTHDMANHTHDYELYGPGGMASTTGPTPASTSGASGDHQHAYDRANSSTDSQGAHSHTLSGTSASASLENRPFFLTCFYIMRVK